MFKPKTEHQVHSHYCKTPAQNNFISLVIATPFPIFLISVLSKKNHLWCALKQAQSTSGISQLSFPFLLLILSFKGFNLFSTPIPSPTQSFQGKYKSKGIPKDCNRAKAGRIKVNRVKHKPCACENNGLLG